MSDRLDALNEKLVAGDITVEQYDAIKSRLVDEQEAIAAAREQYGAPAGAGTGAPTPPTSRSHFAPDAIKQRIWDKLERGEGLQHPGDRVDVNAFGITRLREALDFQRSTHPELGINGLGGSYRGEGAGNPVGTPVVDARNDALKSRKRGR